MIEVSDTDGGDSRGMDSWIGHLCSRSSRWMCECSALVLCSISRMCAPSCAVGRYVEPERERAMEFRRGREREASVRESERQRDGDQRETLRKLQNEPPFQACIENEFHRRVPWRSPLGSHVTWSWHCPVRHAVWHWLDVSALEAISRCYDVWCRV